MAYATARLHGTVAALSPQGTGMGQIDGYIVADYLLQHATRERRSARVPASTWDALLSHHGDHVDVQRLADSAEGRLLYCYAIPLYRRVADAGDGYAARQLAGLLHKRGDLDGLRARADNGDPDAAVQLVGLLRERGTWTGSAPGPTPVTGMPPGIWSTCCASAGTWTGCVPRRWRPRRRRPTDRADGRAGSERRGGEVAPVRFEPRRVNCLCVKASGPGVFGVEDQGRPRVLTRPSGTRGLPASWGGPARRLRQLSAGGRGS